MTKTYTAHLMDCRGVSDADRREAEQLFCYALEQHFGSVEGVLSALVGGIDSETWLDGERAATRSAFAGWHRAPHEAYFEVSASEE